MHILSIQSQVVYGHVGNSATMFPLQRRGHEVWSVPTTILSNHAGYPDVGGQALAPETVADLLAGLERRGAFARCDLLITGYLAGVETAAVVADAMARLRAANPGLVYCCDPVMGDAGPGLYVDHGLPEHFAKRALPGADIATPNQFELERLCGLESGWLAARDLSESVVAARALLEDMRPDACCLVTSARHRSGDPETVSVIAVDRASAWRVDTPLLAFPVAPHGAGDLISGLFATSITEHGEVARAIEESVATVFAVLSATQRGGRAELDMVAAGDSIVAPAQQFAARIID